ncbi:hypothetical protein AMST5_04088 [freshwater sediment metagenome]|uniref:Uncharacterized protein n=1 Tax=freshwater sediment metagenome TaxID=556182 RepID=A0AA48M5S5_9ZZZZ
MSDVKTRIAAILNLEEAKGREAMAQKIALETELSVEKAADLLSAAPRASAISRAVEKVNEKVAQTNGFPRVLGGEERH